MSDDTSNSNELHERIDEFARTPHVLIACDYDGTLAPIVEDPAQAHPLRESIVALRTLAEQMDTPVAVISGRALGELARLSGFDGSVHLVGSHGSEFDAGFINSLTEEQTERRERILESINRVSSDTPGSSVETKPASIAFHYRNTSDRNAARNAVETIESGPASWDDVQVKRGKEVIELSVVPTNKGTAIQTLRQRVGASAVFFIGDDVTDEDAFETLRGPDIGVKVGSGDTRADFRVDSPNDVAALLARLCERRAEWICGSDAVPIDHHTMLSDQRTVALVTPDARVVWMCTPRIDSPSIFAEILGGPTAGYFSISPTQQTSAKSQRYIEGSLACVTEFDTITVTDFLDIGGGRTKQRAGRSDLVRLIEGTGEVRVEFAPRLDFGRVPTSLEVRDRGVEVVDAPEQAILYAPGFEWELVSEGRHQTAIGTITLTGEPVELTLRIGSTSLRDHSSDAHTRLEANVAEWHGWRRRLTLPDRHQALVDRSALTLKALVHGPSGGIAAAATTSLPETLGGVRNWDYRYCWPRDAAISAIALTKLGSQREAMDLLEWTIGVVERAISPDRIQPLYTVTGEELSTEGEIAELTGYAGSRPVRVGNAAARQVQLDVFGPVVDLVYELARRDAPLTPHHWRIVEALVGAVRARWHEPDHGIWEIRDHRRNHVHSKVMCWLTVDRAIKAAEFITERSTPDWERLRDEIARDVCERGFNNDLNAFTASYEQTEADAAALWVGLSGLLPPDDPRVASTVDYVEQELRDGPVVFRYRFDDNLPGVEGGFNICTTWLIQSYALLGRKADAESLLDDYADLAGPTGLLAEEYAPGIGRALGNHPQAYSHAGLIEAVLAVDAMTTSPNDG